MPVQIIFETMARLGRGKTFETTVGYLTVPVQNTFDTLARFVRGK